MKTHYDAIVVGARAAGAATAMLLARNGLRVLVTDRSRYGSDTLSTHALMRPAVMQLSRWGLLDNVISSGAPAIGRAIFHYPDEKVELEIEPLYAPRRTVLDAILVDAAAAAGAEIAFGVAINDLQKNVDGRVVGVLGRDAEGNEIRLRCDLVVGADGIRSVVAAQADAAVTRNAIAGGATLFAYFSGIEAAGYEWVYGEQVASGLIPTNDGETCVFIGGQAARFRRDVHPDLERGFASILAESSPAVAARVAAGLRTSKFRGFAGVHGYYRRPFGPGWALVGDAGYFRDPITTHGISDAFRDAELLTRAVTGLSTFAEYERIRDEVTLAMFEVTGKIAAYDWSSTEIRTHLRNVSRAMKPEIELILGFDRKEAAGY